MTTDKTQITLNRQQFDSLLKIFYLGKWMLESHHDDFDIKFKREQDLEQFIFAQAGNHLVEFSADDGRFFPTAKFEETMQKTIEEYDDHTFWEELTYRLADRDFQNEFGKKLKKWMRRKELTVNKNFLTNTQPSLRKMELKILKYKFELWDNFSVEHRLQFRHGANYLQRSVASSARDHA